MSALNVLTATIKKAQIVPSQFYPDNLHVHGEIWWDTKGRADGSPVYTSTIMEGPDANGVVTTRSGSRYKLEMLR